MTERATFGIGLENQVTGPGRAISSSLRSVRNSLRRVQAQAIATGASMSKAVTRPAAAVAGARVAFGGLGRTLGTVFSAKMFGQIASGFESLNEATERSPLFKAIGSIGKFARINPIMRAAGGIIGTIGGGLLSVGRRVMSMFTNIAKNAFLISGALGTVATVILTRATVNAAAFREQMELSLGMLTRGEFTGKEVFNIGANLSKELALPLESAVRSMQELLRARFTVQSAKEFVELSSDLRAVGASAGDVERAIRAITQIKGKGVLSMEELKLQLADAGLGVELVTTQLGKLLGKTPQQAMELIGKGAVSAEMGLKAIKLAILDITNATEPGEAARRFASTTLTGALEQFKTAPGRLFDRIAQSSTTSVVKMQKMIRGLTKDIDKMSPKGLANFVTGVLSFVRTVTPLVTSFIEGVGSGLGELSKNFESIGVTKEMREAFRGFGRGAAKGFGLFIKTAVTGLQLLVKIGPAVGRLFTGIMSAFGMDEGFKSIKEGIDAINVERLGQLFENVGKAIGTVARSIVDDVANAIKHGENLFVDVGIALGTGLVKGMARVVVKAFKQGPLETFSFLMKAGKALVNPAAFVGQMVGESLANRMKASARESLDAHSPSKEFIRIGQDTMDGLKLGMDFEGPQTQVREGIGKLRGAAEMPVSAMQSSGTMPRKDASSFNAITSVLQSIESTVERVGRFITHSMAGFSAGFSAPSMPAMALAGAPMILDGMSGHGVSQGEGGLLSGMSRLVDSMTGATRRERLGMMPSTAAGMDGVGLVSTDPDRLAQVRVDTAPSITMPNQRQVMRSGPVTVKMESVQVNVTEAQDAKATADMVMAMLPREIEKSFANVSEQFGV